MADTEFLDGLKKVVKNLNTHLQRLSSRSFSGLVKGGLLILRDAQKGTPVVSGNLRSSGYLVASNGADVNIVPYFVDKQGKELHTKHAEVVRTGREFVRSVSRTGGGVEIGFSASYAAYVHENPMAGAVDLDRKARQYPPYKNSTRQRYSVVGGYKFLENSVEENSPKVLAIIISEGRKG